MNLILLTFKLMWKRAIGENNLYWFLSFLPIALLIITPSKQILTQLITLFILLPPVFLLLNWNSSTIEKGLLALISRSDGYKKVKITQWLLPAIIAVTLASITVWIKAIPPWQFWITMLFVSFSFSILFSITEAFFKYQGRLFFSILWIAQISGFAENNKIMNFLLFTNYPEKVLLANRYENFLHPDSYVLASLILLLISSSAYFYIFKTKISNLN